MRALSRHASSAFYGRTCVLQATVPYFVWMRYDPHSFKQPGKIPRVLFPATPSDLPCHLSVCTSRTGIFRGRSKVVVLALCSFCRTHLGLPTLTWILSATWATLGGGGFQGDFTEPHSSFSTNIQNPSLKPCPSISPSVVWVGPHMAQVGRQNVWNNSSYDLSNRKGNPVEVNEFSLTNITSLHFSVDSGEHCVPSTILPPRTVQLGSYALQ